MADNTDDLLEENTDSGEEQAGKSKGLSTALLIKVAIGLGVLLIALIVAFFFFSPATDEEDTAGEAVQSEVAAVTEDMPADTSDEIELPPVEDSASAPLAASEAVDTTSTSAPATQTSPATSSELLSEMLALQKQISSLQQDNQKLIRQVEQLVEENDKLKTQVSQLTAQRPDLDEVIADDQLVNNNQVPGYYREDRYRNTPQPELAPKWGEFDQLDSN